jgi:hypothetical protein
MMRVEPNGEGALLLAQLLQASRIFDERLDLQPIAGNSGICQQPAFFPRAIGRHLVDIEPSKAVAKAASFFNAAPDRPA